VRTQNYMVFVGKQCDFRSYSYD